MAHLGEDGDAVGERYERLRTRLRSDRAEHVFGVILMVFLSTCVGAALALALPDVVWSEAWPVTTTYVVGCLAAGAALAVLIPRWPARWMREWRSLWRGTHWPIVSMWLPIGLFLVLPFAPGAAETYACERGDGILVRTSWTDSNESSGTKTGVYTYGGETYEITVSAEEYLVRQVAPEQPPTADNPYYTRTYRVPWAGSSMVCATPGHSDRNDVVGMGAMGVVGSTIAARSALELLRRRRASR